MTEAKILIVGAGPTGLSLALRLSRYGVPFRIIDRAPGPGTASRAMAVHARTLEFYQQLGLGDAVTAQGIPIEAMALRQGGKAVATLSFKDIGASLSPYPYVMSYPQDDHERFLVAQLAAANVEIEWNVALEGLSQDDEAVEAIVRKDGVQETVRCAYLVGCDGGHSAVRHALDIGFAGGTYPNRFYVVDAKLEGDMTTTGAMTFGSEIFALKLPVRSRQVHRLIGILPPALVDLNDVTIEDIRPHVEPLLDTRIIEVNWFSTYYSHHRVAARFRDRRCFLAGDAGHVHSPAGGQGMNTGIGDSVNLAWKLAAVARGRAGPQILDTYESERMAFARTLVATTDRAFRFPIQTGVGGRVLRQFLLPNILPLLFRSAAFRTFLFRTVSQTQIAYRDSALSEGRGGGLSGGDRLPWAPPPGRDNFAPLQSLEWQIHVYGRPRAPLPDACARLHLPLHAFMWNDGLRRAGFARDAAYLVRPDGHIGLVLPQQNTSALDAYVRRHGLNFGG